MFFESWQEFYRLLVSCIIVYVGLVIFLRVSGKRTLSKWNAFDFIVTIALGSVLASAILSKSTAILEGLFASFVLIFLQFIITFFGSRIDFIDKIIKASPTLLYYRGHYREKAMKGQRVSEAEILSAIRSSGVGAVDDVEAVVLETDGSFSVIEISESECANSALSDVEGFTEAKEKYA